MKPIKTVTLIDSNHISSEGLKRIIEQSPTLTVKNHFTDISTQNGNKYLIDSDIAVLHHKSDTHLSSQTLASFAPTSKLDTLAILPTSNSSLIQKFWSLGVASILTTECSEQELSTALDMVSKGQRFYCNRILEMVAKPEEPTSELSDRETEVLRQLAEGKTTQQIADSLFVSIHTINSHRKNIMKKLGFKSPVEMIVYAVKNEILT